MTSVFQGISLSRSRGRQGEDPGNEVALLQGGRGQSYVNAFAIFIFSAQINSETDVSDKPKSLKFISKSLINLSLTLQPLIFCR